MSVLFIWRIFGSFELIYTHDFRKTDDTPAALAGEMEYSFKTTI
ncbi:hypothetical protein DJ93_3302 [Bacillus clarus]|uniref:Uncharacterized protein n=1 Tax=Bacillus clarus TaxID=2338372 RepID=A0A090YUV4_9BACI|nr:hypothetical protein DJ93_3302 [Bacillus clarus]